MLVVAVEVVKKLRAALAVLAVVVLVEIPARLAQQTLAAVAAAVL
jgi:hypothetical protein